MREATPRQRQKQIPYGNDKKKGKSKVTVEEEANPFSAMERLS
jgi:hypothetical protein